MSKHSLNPDGVEAYENLLKVVLIGDDREPESKSLKDPFQELVGNDYIVPPIDMGLWALALDQNTRLNRCVRTYARNTVGLGWEILSRIHMNEDTPSSVRKAVERETLYLNNLFEYPNKKMPFPRVSYLMKIDEEAVGNGYFEISRSLKGVIDGIFHIRGSSIRILKAERGFVQVKGGKKRYFKNFGDDRIMNSESGEFKTTPFKLRANELIHFENYSPNFDYYGVPRFLAAAPAIAGNRLAAERNIAFFENDTVPRLAITVSGGRLDQKSIDSIKEFLRRHHKNPENAHRVMIIQAEPKRQTVGRDLQTKITIEKLTVGVTEDASFLGYRQENDEEIRETFGISEVFFRMREVNRAGAQVGKDTTNDQEFEPDRLEKEYRINASILRDSSIDAKHTKFAFKRPRIVDQLDQSLIDKIYAEAGALTPNELRERIGKDPYPSSASYSEKPFPLSLIEAKASLVSSATQKSGSKDTKKSIDIVSEDLQEQIDSINDNIENLDLKINKLPNVEDLVKTKKRFVIPSNGEARHEDEHS